MSGLKCERTMEQKIFFPASDGIKLEGALFPGNDQAAILAHPHPLYGGNMDNLVICEIAAACRARGLTTLRFNFRGAGQSRGAYDQGAGEQKDLLAAADYVQARGARAIDLIGYSFGAWVLAHADTGKLPPGRMLMIAPPAAMMNFDGLRPCSRLKLAVTGSEDEIAPPALVEKLLPRINPAAELRVISGADHFFSSGMAELKTAVSDFMYD
ncbi:MAG: alpha/beta hydrolase [Desulfobacteraceae bacterium]|nr:alpha/beta hydrolase [Desulfobacteraceae bacterium]